LKTYLRTHRDAGGATFVVGARADKITTDRGRATGIEATGDER